MSHYTIQVSFKTIGWLIRTNRNLLDAEIAKLFDMILKLNSSGRNYLEKDPENQLKGFDVLGKVSDSLDCLFFHLRENPMLCQRKLPVPTEAMSQKRKATSQRQSLAPRARRK
jgi:hypothetical protein